MSQQQPQDVIDVDNVAAEDQQQQAPPQQQQDTITPLAVGQVDKAAKRDLRDGVRLSKECRIALHKAATITVMMLGTLADEARFETAKGSKKPRETLTGADVVKALDEAGMSAVAQRIDNGKKRKKQ